MNIEKTKAEFITYLQKQGKIDPERIVDEDTSISIFKYGNDYRDFLYKEYNAGTSIYDKSIDEILNMKIENGQLIDPDEEDELTTEDIDSIKKELEAEQQAQYNATEQEIMYSMQYTDNETAAIEEEQSEIEDASIENNTEAENNIPAENNTNAEEINDNEAEVSQNNTIVNEENIEQNTQIIPNNNENTAQVQDVANQTQAPNNTEENFSLGEFYKDLNELRKDSTKDIVKNDDKIKKTKSKKADKVKKNKAQKTETNNSAPTANYSGAGGVSSYAPSNVVNEPTLDELKQERSEKQTKLETAQTELNQVHSGENEAVQGALEKLNEAQQEYTDALASDTNVADELKAQQTENLTAITQKETEINETNIKLNDKKNEIQDQKAAVNADKSNVKALQEALSSLNSQKSDDPERKKEIEANKKEVEQKLKEAQSQLEQNQNKLDQLKQEKDEIKAELDTKKTELDDLNNTKTQIEQEILKTCSDETKSKLEAYNTAKENYEKTKADELSKAQNNVSELQKEIKELNKKINQKEADETKYKYAGGDFANDFKNNNSFKNGVLADKGAYIEQICQQYGIDPYLAASIMGLETGYGTSNAIRNYNNPGGYMDPSTGCSKLRQFSSLDEGIEAVVRNLSKNYINQGLNTITKIGNKYCPVGAANDPNGTNSSWIPSVTRIYNDLTGKNINSNTVLN